MRHVRPNSYMAWDLEPFARDSGWFGQPFVWDEASHTQLRRKDEATYGTCRTRDTILALYDQFSEASTTGKAFVSPLEPPPGDIRACHPPKN